MQSFPHSSEYRHFLAELRAARDAVGVTQEELASKLRVHQTLISKGELGTRRVDVVELRAWLAALGVTLSDFVEKLETRWGRHSQLPQVKKKQGSSRR